MRRIRISEQLLLVFFLAVLLPLCVAAVIVLNINQHAVRAELRYSASITTDNVYRRLINKIEESKLAVTYIAKSLSYIKSRSEIDKFLNDIASSSDEISKIELVDNINNFNLTNLSGFLDSTTSIFHDSKNNDLVIYIKLKNSRYLKEVINLSKLEDEFFKYLITDKRQVYIIDSHKNIVMSYNREDNTFKQVLPYLPKHFEAGKPVLFGKLKNQPNIFLKIKEPDWSIIVVTPKTLTSYGIINARYKIILSLIIAAFTMIIIGVWYSFSLNTNIKQLLKVISAIEKGNYRKRVRMLKDFFTPYEIVFLGQEFNKMAAKIDKSYEELQKANKKLSKLDEMKSNLIDTVSHEFRTPLTNIRGYTSRLLRNDINVDEETKIKSLKVIKQQTERLSRLVEDLLVIPDIESSVLRIFPDSVSLKDVIETCILAVHQRQNRVINFTIDENLPEIWADPDRIEQVIINLLDNSIKYSPENTDIDINVHREDNNAVVKVRNECERIPETVLNTLFDKFTRLDDNLIRTTRGTGLGLFIAKGIIEAMNGKISLSSKNGFEACFTLPLSIVELENTELPTGQN